MTRSKQFGYFHAVLATAWFSIGANDTAHIVNGFLGDGGCTAISLFLVVPLTWLAAMIYGFPLFPTMTEHYIWMSIIGAVVIVNGLVIGYCLDRFLSWAGMPDRRINPKRSKKAEQAAP